MSPIAVSSASLPFKGQSESISPGCQRFQQRRYLRIASRRCFFVLDLSLSPPPPPPPPPFPLPPSLPPSLSPLQDSNKIWRFFIFEGREENMVGDSGPEHSCDESSLDMHDLIEKSACCHCTRLNSLSRSPGVSCTGTWLIADSQQFSLTSSGHT